MQTLTITCPDDFHLHLRDGAMMHDVVEDSARQFARAIIMPNLKPPIVTTAQALAYRERIKSALPPGCRFEPMMTLFLTDNTPADEIRAARENAHIYAVKYYPAGATTNSENGVTSIDRVYPLLELMEEIRFPLLMHGEVTDADIDIFDRERVFIERILDPLMQRFVNLPVVFEHITTRQAVEFINQGPDNLAATITPHHLLLNRNALLARGLRPHYYCLPVLKADNIVKQLLQQQPAGIRGFFWEQTAHRMPDTPRNQPAVVPASIPHTVPLNYMQRFLNGQGAWIDWKILPVVSVLNFTGCHKIAAA